MYGRGFTLIELLMVISIIAIFAAIVLAALSGTRAKASDAKVKGQLVQMRNAAELYSVSNGNSFSPSVGNCAGGMFTSATGNMATIISSTQTAVSGSGNIDCGSNGLAWSVAVQLPSGAYYCVDSAAASWASVGNGTTPYSGALTGGANSPHTSAGATTCH